MQVFTRSTIYAHLNQAHGGYNGNADAGNQYGAPVVPREEEDDGFDQYALQVELLRQAAQLRERHLAQLRREEQLMLETFGDDYRQYMSRTYRIIPLIF